ncbi:MAG: protein kinase [Anaerolineales bacterium]
MASLIGKEIGKYRITERIGRGGMADVYLGIHTHLDRKVAIKVLHSHLLEGGDFVARFKREAKAVANLRHPNIVQVYDFDVTDEMIFMVMEFIDGTSLHSRLVEVGNRGERLPIKLIGSIINDIAGALDYAHSKGMLHRDIKPSNILLDQNDKAYLTDFGIAKLLDDQKFTATGTLVGTPAYMSPEQGMGEDLTEESDIYSLGIVAFEMLTGQVPYDAKTPIGIVHKQINDPVPELSKLVDGVPGTAQEVLNRALAKSPEGRYNRAEDLVKALRVALQALDSTEPIVKQAAAQVEEILDAPTVTMEKQDLEKATVVMESEKPAKKSEKKPEPKEKAPKKKIPTWAFIVGGVALLVVVGVILTQVLGMGSKETDLQPGAVEVFIDAGGTGEGLLIPPGGDGDVEIQKVAGEQVFTTGNCQPMPNPEGDSDADAYLYIDIDDQIIHDLPQGSAVSIFVEFLNQGRDQLRIEYDAHAGGPYGDGSFKSSQSIEKSDTGDFKTAEFILNDALFANRINGADFRILDNCDGEEYIRKVTVVYIPPAEVGGILEGSAEELFFQGEAFYQEGEIGAAIEAFENAIQAGYTDVEVYIQLGRAKRDSGDFYGAIEQLTTAVQIDPGNFGAWYSLAEAYYNTGEEVNAGPAHEAMDHALALNPDDPNAHWLMGMIRYEMFGNPDEAIEDLTRAIELAPDSPYYYHIRAGIYKGIERWDLCVADENEAIALNSDDPFVYYNRAECYFALGDIDLAREEFSVFLERSEGNPNPDLESARQDAQAWLDSH